MLRSVAIFKNGAETWHSVGGVLDRKIALNTILQTPFGDALRYSILHRRDVQNLVKGCF